MMFLHRNMLINPPHVELNFEAMLGSFSLHFLSFSQSPHVSLLLPLFEPILGGSWEASGGVFSLKSRRKNGQDDFGTRSDNFFSASEASRDPLGASPDAFLDALRPKSPTSGQLEAI